MAEPRFFASVDAATLTDRLHPVAARVAEFGRRASLRCLCPIMGVLVRIQSWAVFTAVSTRIPFFSSFAWNRHLGAKEVGSIAESLSIVPM